MKIGLMTRCKEEFFIGEFVHYYLSQGIDYIYILDDDSQDKGIYHFLFDDEHKHKDKDEDENEKDKDKKVKITNKVEVRYEKNIIEKNSIKTLYDEIKDQYDWLIYVDVDEFITTNTKSKKTIREELETTFKDDICVKIPWVLMACQSKEKDPVSLLKENTYRWNHDNKHINTVTTISKFRCRYEAIEVKCIFKPRYFTDIFDHHPLFLIDDTLKNKIVESIHHNVQELSPFYQLLREEDIKTGYLLCYHYRIISIESCKRKIQTNIWYKDFTLQDLLSIDHPEVLDTTMLYK